ncbi:hypothetical protein EKO27_g3612 [Xylaria grammica]|uniref:AAA+ ATPase domain-containing protein n=1 Tax=Xylaria grammica TaxID=363999 RepID=A0A439DAR8_9PEZI|nr:hypothetical protein EKO27_g3612 [Xylaria grammica]
MRAGNRALQQYEADEASRETAGTPHDTPSPSISESEQSSNYSSKTEESRSPNYAPFEESTHGDDNDSSNESIDDEDRTRLADPDLELVPTVDPETISDDRNLSDKESDQLSDNEEESDSEEGSINYDEDASSPCAENIALDRACSLLARHTKTFDVQESSSITISDDFSHSAKVEERQFLALRTTKEPTPPPPSLDSLQHYQMQLMLLEQQNRKRSIMAREEMDSKAPTASRLKSAFDNPQYQASGSTSLQDAGYQNNPRKRLHSQLQLHDEILGLGVDELQDYITRLEQRAKDLGASAVSKSQPAFTYRTLYRILEWDKNSKKFLSAPFFDPPEWIGSNRGGTLRCRVPVNNFDLFLEKNKDISFIVYKTYVALFPMQQAILAQNANEPTIKIDESIKPITQELIEAVKALLTSKHEYENLWSAFRISGELLAPYLFVYHQRTVWQEIRASIETSSEEQMTMFWDYIIQNHGDEFAAADACISEGKVSAKYVPYLFKPGDILVQKQGDSYLGWISTSWAKHESTHTTTRGQLVNMKAGASQIPLYGTEEASDKVSNEKLWVQEWSASAWHWEFDGNFQRRNRQLRFSVVADTVADSQASKKMKLLDTRNETMPIQDLQVYPLRFAPEEIVKQLRMRGKRFWKCRNRSFVSYEEKIMGQETTADERYMIDLKAYRSLHKNNQYESAGYRSGLADELGPEAMERDEPPDEKFEFLLPATIKGFNMRRKKWYDLVPERVREVEWNKGAFQKVVMNSKAKDLIQALVSNQLAVEASTPGADLIEGKGNGLILLLHGSPGTGKTLTAESVAEIAEKPLYRVTCADIGTKAEDAEKYLESILHLGKLWRCVVLLDEAEVFLEQRSLEDLERNALVSVFLRVLEYYEGILILTTNRVGTFDEAFKSRIQLALHYPTLGPYQRLQDDTVETGDLRDHLDELCKEDMNGRQIRNALTTARQYAKWKGERLNYAKLKDVIEVAGRFDKYLVKLHKGLTHDQLAEDEGLR